MIDSNREEFEKLPVVAGILSNHVFWHDECEQYQASDDDTMDNADWLNGAWYMHKEQQKKLDCCREENRALLIKLNVPDGYKLVPVDKLMDCLSEISDRSYIDDNVSEIKAMIGAAP